MHNTACLRWNFLFICFCKFKNNSEENACLRCFSENIYCTAKQTWESYMGLFCLVFFTVVDLIQGINWYNWTAQFESSHFDSQCMRQRDIFSSGNKRKIYTVYFSLVAFTLSTNHQTIRILYFIHPHWVLVSIIDLMWSCL